MICLLVETTTTIKISGRLYIHHLFLNRPLNSRNNTRDDNAPKLIMVVILCAWVNTFWTKNWNFWNAVSGSSKCCNATRPNMGINCSLWANLSYQVSIFNKNLTLTYIMMMIATAVIKPLNNARLRTTSMKPKRKNPRKNVNSPACNVITVATAIPTSCFLSKWGSVERRSWLYSCTACPMSKLSAASGATLSCLDEPSSAYTRPGMDAEN